MYTEELYPELVEYIYQFEARFQTEDEKLAGRSFLYNAKGMSDTAKQLIVSKGWFSDEPRIKAMMAGGYESFKFKVVQRIYSLHKHELDLNLCPECGKIARTPKAQQCRWCFTRFNKLQRIREI